MIFKSPLAITEGNTWHLSCKLARCLHFSCMCECVCVHAHVCCRCEKETEMGEAGRERRGRSRRGNMWRYDTSLPWNVLLCSLQVHLPSPWMLLPNSSVNLSCSLWLSVEPASIQHWWIRGAGRCISLCGLAASLLGYGLAMAPTGWSRPTASQVPLSYT